MAELRMARGRWYFDQSESATSGISHQCLRPLNAVTVVGLVRELLIRHFGHSENLLYDELRQYRWDPTDATPIVIEYAYNWVPDKLGRRPALFIVRGPLKRQKMSIGNRLIGNAQKYMGVQMWMGTIAVNCLAANPVIAELLADEVARFLSHFSPIILACTNLAQFEVDGISQLAVAEEYKPNFLTSVPIRFAYQDEWQIESDRQSLNELQRQVYDAVHLNLAPPFRPDEVVKG